MTKIKAEYIWIDGHKPTPKLRSKTKIINGPVAELTQLPDWSFDGSSTLQAKGHDSDRALHPVAFFRDPIRGGEHILVMNEVKYPDGTPHETNKRVHLVEISEKYHDHEPWFGIEQEYTFFRGRSPLGWPEGGYPAPQGPFYCGVGADEVFGRDIVEKHMDACLYAGINISGINAEVMPGQWEFQIGPLDPLSVADQLWIARWILYRIAEDFGIKDLPPQTAYRALQDMEQRGWVIADWDMDGAQGPPRKVYRITGEGELALEAWADDIDDLRAALEAFLTSYRAVKS